MIHFSVFLGSPTHGLPPNCGGLHTLSRIRTPSPMLTEQSLNSPHWLQNPSTKKNQSIILNVSILNQTKEVKSRKFPITDNFG